MDERSPLDNRSLSHTSREPEGQAWAQIGTKAGTKVQTVTPPATTASSASPAAPAKDPPRAEEDALSDDGRSLQVVEDAEQERSNDDSTNNATEEKKESAEASSAAAPGSATSSTTAADKLDGSGRERSEKNVRDRTNSLDPKSIRARVFVGHLNTEKCSRSELEDLFSPFGAVASCSLQHGYGFVQYYDEQAAKRAITELHGLQFKGMKLGMT